MTKCRIDKCDRVVYARGLCKAHYARWRYSGKEPTPGPFRLQNAEPSAHFWKNVDKRGPHECWPWLGLKGPDGYGKAWFKKKWCAPHRFSYALHKGPIPETLEIDHLCRNTSCVNPAHLEAVTRLENIRRRYALQTHCKRGHEFTPENTGRNSGTGARYCKTCLKAWKHARYARLKAQQ